MNEAIQEAKKRFPNPAPSKDMEFDGCYCVGGAYIMAQTDATPGLNEDWPLPAERFAFDMRWPDATHLASWIADETGDPLTDLEHQLFPEAFAEEIRDGALRLDVGDVVTDRARLIYGMADLVITKNDGGSHDEAWQILDEALNENYARVIDDLKPMQEVCA